MATVTYYTAEDFVDRLIRDRRTRFNQQDKKWLMDLEPRHLKVVGPKDIILDTRPPRRLTKTKPPKPEPLFRKNEHRESATPKPNQQPEKIPGIPRPRRLFEKGERGTNGR